jgi:hypothetical protein
MRTDPAKRDFVDYPAALGLASTAGFLAATQYIPPIAAAVGIKPTAW